MPSAARRLGCILGAATADAAAQPIHWNYNLQKLHAILGNAEETEFWTPSVNPFYCIETGKQTFYGDQAYAILETLAECKGFDLNHLKQTTYKMFGLGSEYDHPKDAEKKLPLKSGWRSGDLRYFLKAMEEHSEKTGHPKSVQIVSACSIYPLVAKFGGQPQLYDYVEQAVRLTQDNELSVAVGFAAARIIEQCLLTTDASTTMVNVVQHVADVLLSKDRAYPKDLDETVAGYLLDVIRCKDVPHVEAITQQFVNS